jgi:hypothetical protein
MYIHGGEWIRGDKASPYPLIRHLAEVGWVSVLNFVEMNFFYRMLNVFLSLGGCIYKLQTCTNISISISIDRC